MTLVVAAALLSGGCAGQDMAPDGSATAAGDWVVEEVLSIGTTAGDSLYEFGDVAGVDTDAEGNVYVADTQAGHVRVFDPAGAYLRTIGRPGSGPGELGPLVAGVFVIGSQVVVPDLANRRISRFELDGSFASDERLDMAQGVPARFDVTTGGRLIAQLRPALPGDEVATVGDPVVTVGPEGAPADTIARLGVGQIVQITGAVPVLRVFAANPMWDSDRSGRLVTAMSDAWRFEVRDLEGAPAHVVSGSFEPVPVTAADQRTVTDELRGMYQSQGVPPNITQQVIDAMTFADVLPAFAAVVLGPDETLWVQTLTGEAALDMRDMGSRTWVVFDASGRPAGEATFPTRFQPVRVVGDLFYGIARDELGVQTVKVYRVRVIA